MNWQLVLIRSSRCLTCLLLLGKFCDAVDRRVLLLRGVNIFDALQDRTFGFPDVFSLSFCAWKRCDLETTWDVTLEPKQQAFSTEDTSHVELRNLGVTPHPLTQ